MESMVLSIVLSHVIQSQKKTTPNETMVFRKSSKYNFHIIVHVWNGWYFPMVFPMESSSEFTANMAAFFPPQAAGFNPGGPTFVAQAAEAPFLDFGMVIEW